MSEATHYDTLGFDTILKRVAAAHGIKAYAAYVSSYANGRKYQCFTTEGPPALAFFANLAEKVGIPLAAIEYTGAMFDREHGETSIYSMDWQFDIGSPSQE